jgi:5-oxoprolinase (ATP-hydrolysing)
VPIKESQPSKNTWQFYIDRGGTFTDVVGIRNDGIRRVHKLLSTNPRHYEDAAVQGIRDMLEADGAVLTDDYLPDELIEEVRLGTTVATNALLERKGEPTVLVTNTGFQDALRIAYQNRPDIFARNIVLPTPLYSYVIELPGRFSASGSLLEEFDEKLAAEELKKAHARGMTSCAIVFMHSYLYPSHEEICADIARKAGFAHVTVSHSTSPLIKLVERGDTTVADAYLSPILHRYLDRFSKPFKSTSVYFMQSNGGLTDRKHFRGKDSLLSGPAGGLVGAVETGKALGFQKIVSFDMGGTSTDVSHFEGQFERQDMTTISGIRIRAPMIPIHTIAAGGGSILTFDGHRLLVGPESAGSFPGPACYRNGGPLTITDANLLLGRIQAEYFPHVFGENADQPLDIDAVAEKFLDLKVQVANVSNFERTEEIAWGFIEIAVEKMARAIKKITIERGYEVKDAVLNSFGGAGGQHACLIAENLGINTVMIHKLAGVLSAMGIGLSSIKVVENQAVQKPLAQFPLEELNRSFDKLIASAEEKLKAQGAKNATIELRRDVLIRYDGSDTTLSVALGETTEMSDRFHESHLQRFGFHSLDRKLIVESIALEATAKSAHATGQVAHKDVIAKRKKKSTYLEDDGTIKLYSKGRWWASTRVYQRDELKVDETVVGPAVVLDDTSTNIIEPGWIAILAHDESLVITRITNVPTVVAGSDRASSELRIQTTRGIVTVPPQKLQAVKADPIKLELFNNKFMAIAEEMGVTLCHTSQSVNIKERLDFSCALFDRDGKLIANAPHMPVHLGSMGESVRAIINRFSGTMKMGDVYVLNNPYEGGTHLPDITVVTPVFVEGSLNGVSNETPLFYTASRGHHADIGGITAGSMPPNSKTIEEEGALIDPLLLVRDGVFDETKIRSILSNCRYPSRNVEQNVSDLKAQIAANNRGVLSLNNLIESFGLQTVWDYMHFVRRNAEDCVRDAIENLADGEFTVSMDSGAKICVKITVDKAARSARVNFAGTSAQLTNNMNAPRAITIAAVLYVFRTLLDSNIPLNDGCLAPLEIIVPEASMLSPRFPAAVVAGNVETSQAIVDAVYGALSVMAASQGTMNNFTFGNARYQYYETISGGSGAGPDHNGCSAVQTHMTNSRLTDPEVLEWRFPVILKEFSIRKGSGGSGKYNGGDGVVRKIQFVEPMQASILSERRSVKPFGMHGGQEGLSGENYVVRKSDDSIVTLTGRDTVEMTEGDIFVIKTPGGGGWGSAS